MGRVLGRGYLLPVRHRSSWHGSTSCFEGQVTDENIYGNVEIKKAIIPKKGDGILGEANPLLFLGLGGIERWVVYPILLWMTGFGGYLLGASKEVREDATPLIRYFFEPSVVSFFAL